MTYLWASIGTPMDGQSHSNYLFGDSTHVSFHGAYPLRASLGGLDASKYAVLSQPSLENSRHGVFIHEAKARIGQDQPRRGFCPLQLRLLSQLKKSWTTFGESKVTAKSQRTDEASSRTFQLPFTPWRTTRSESSSVK